MINNIVLIGRLTKDPDLKYTANGTAVATFSLAVNRNFTNASGEREADFINCVIWRKPAETLANYARKGHLISLQGRLQTRNYENQQGQRVYVTEVVVEHFDLLEKRDANNASGGGQGGGNTNTSNYNQNGSSGSYGGSSDPFGTSVDISEDVPF